MVDNLISVEAVVNSNKRFGIPKIEQSLLDISDSTNTSNINNNDDYIEEEQSYDDEEEEDHDENVKRAKKARKVLINFI